MKKADKHFNKVLLCLERFVCLKSLDLSGNVLSAESARSLSKFLGSTFTLERLNLSRSLHINMATRIVLHSLMTNQTLKYLNLSLNKFNHIDSEFESALGRLVTVQTTLQHLDISFSHITAIGLMFICSSLLHNQSIQAIHLGQTALDYYGRLLLRHILNARVKCPFRSSVQMCEYVRRETDKNQVVILNSFLMSNLPPVHGLDGSEARRLQAYATKSGGGSQAAGEFTGAKEELLREPVADLAAVKEVLRDFMSRADPKSKGKAAASPTASPQRGSREQSLPAAARRVSPTRPREASTFLAMQKAKGGPPNLSQRLEEIQRTKEGGSSDNSE